MAGAACYQVALQGDRFPLPLPGHSESEAVVAPAPVIAVSLLARTRLAWKAACFYRMGCREASSASGHLPAFPLADYSLRRFSSDNPRWIAAISSASSEIITANISKLDICSTSFPVR